MIMVEVQVTATVKVVGGPTVSVGTSLTPEAYTFARIKLSEAGGAEESAEVPLLPDDGTVSLLAINVRPPQGEPGTITVEPANGTETGEAVEVKGTLLVANSGVLAALVKGGPRSLTLKNLGEQPVDIDILTGRNAEE